MPRRFETIVDAARERSIAPPPAPKPASLYATQAVLFSVLWWFWLYAIGHILMYLIVVGGPQLGLGETNQEVGNYLASFDIGIAIVAAVTALAGCLVARQRARDPAPCGGAESSDAQADSAPGGCRQDHHVAVGRSVRVAARGP
tara:strand:+ start:284 stop:715 length:432 start_codon:yes stop_codon:yes gene_type:complete